MSNKITIIRLLFKKEDHLEKCSKIIDEDQAFIYSLLKLAGCNECPEEFEIKLGIINENISKKK